MSRPLSPTREGYRPAHVNTRTVAATLPLVLGLVSLAFLLRFLVAGAKEADLMSSVAFAVTAIPFLLAWLAAPTRLLHPLSVLGFTMLLGVAGQTAYLGYINGQVRAVTFESPFFQRLAGLPLNALASGLLVTAAGLGALAIGYHWLSAGDRPQVGRVLRYGLKHGLAAPAPRRMLWAVLVLCAISLVSFVLYAPLVGITSIESLLVSQKRFGLVQGELTGFGYHRWGISLAGVGVIVGAHAITQHGISWRSGLGGITLVALALTAFYALVTSSRTDVFVVLAVATLTVVAVRQREPRPASIAAATLVAVLAIAAFSGLRLFELEGRSNVAVFSSDSMLAQIFASGDWMDVGPLSVIVTRVPEQYDYTYGRTVLSLLWAPVPRTVWPEKPPVRIGPELGQRVLGFDPDRRSGDPPGFIGEMWVNGGLIGVLVGMAVLGALLRWVERLYRASPATAGLSAVPYGLLLVALALVLPTGDVTGTGLFVIQYLLSLTAVLWLARVRPERAARETPAGVHEISPT